MRIDDYQAACAITRHLIELGHRDIGFIRGDPKHTPSALRSRAFFDTMAAAGLAVAHARVAESLFTYRSGLLAATALLHAAPRPTAILCSNDDMAAAAMAIAHGLRLPEDLSITGFDDTPVATTIWPELTTIHQPVTAMGRAAATLLLAEIGQRRDGLPSRGIHQVMRYTLVSRVSSAPPARNVAPP